LGAGVQAFRRAEEPVECDNDKVDEVSFCWPVFRVIGVESVIEATEDGGVDRVGSGCWVVVGFERLEVRSEYGM